MIKYFLVRLREFGESIYEVHVVERREKKEFLQRVKTIREMRTSAEVAEFLIGKGIQGKRESPFSCPLANYLSVNGDVVKVMGTDAYSFTHGHAYIGPKAVGFQIDFDFNKYPQLEIGENIE